MNQKWIVWGVLLAFCLCIAIFFSKDATPQTVWKGFRVLAVDKSIVEEDVLAALAKKKITRVISLSSKRYDPFDRENLFSPELVYAPIQPLFQQYQAQLDRYFFDQSKNFTVYYIPNTANLEKKLTAALSDFTVPWYFEGVPSSNVLGKLFFLGILFFLLFTTKKKFFYAAMALPFLTSFFFLPDFSFGIASLFFIHALLLFLPYGETYHFIAALKKDTCIIVFLVSSVLCAGFGGIRIVLIFSGVSIVSIFCAFLYLWITKELIKKHNQQFFPIPIRSARNVVLSKAVYQFHCFMLLFGVCVLSLAFIIGGVFFPHSEGIAPVSIPQPDIHSKQKLDYVHFAEFYRQSKESLPNTILVIAYYWDIMAFPFTSLHDEKKPPAFNDEIVYKTYAKDDLGIIHERYEKIHSLDEQFITHVFQKINGFGNSIEKLIIGQGFFCTVSYAPEQRKIRKTIMGNVHLYKILLSLGFIALAFLINAGAFPLKPKGSP